MEATQEKKNVHHGNNVRLARTWKKVTQEDLADRLNMYQGEISKLEGQEEIQDNMLEKISKALDVSVDFLKEFEPEGTIYNFNFNNQQDSVKVIAEENTKDTVLQGQGEQNNNITNHYYPIEDIKSLYDKLLFEKDKLIERLEKEIAALKEKHKKS